MILGSNIVTLIYSRSKEKHNFTLFLNVLRSIQKFIVPLLSCLFWPLSFDLRCKEDICHGVGSLLVYVKSLKGLAAIRDAVWDLLSTDSISQHWSSVCQQLLERPLAVWDNFLQQLFLQRLQVG